MAVHLPLLGKGKSRPVDILEIVPAWVKYAFKELRFSADMSNSIE